MNGRMYTSGNSISNKVKLQKTSSKLYNNCSFRQGYDRTESFKKEKAQNIQI